VSKNINIKVTKTLYQRLTKYPTADVVEVVRCKDCKYMKHDIAGEPYCKFWTDATGDFPDYYCDVEYYGFCSYGERKDAK
jgi:hypothetical protein